MKVFMYYCLPDLSYTTVFPNSHPPLKAMTIFIVFYLLALRRKLFIIYEMYYIHFVGLKPCL